MANINPPKIGEVFNKLTVIKESFKKSDDYVKYFICKCECGNIKEIFAGNLRNGHTRSCGCNQTKARIKAPGVFSWNRIYKNYKGSAKTRGVFFDITIQNFIKIMSLDCTYCGSPPQPFNAYRKKDGSLNYSGLKAPEHIIDRSWIKVNGIDRINSNLGYILENCTPCCTICNYLKMDLDKEEFLTHVLKIHEFQKRTI